MSRCTTRRAHHPVAGLDVDHLEGALRVWEAALADDVQPYLLRLRDIDGTSVELGALPIDGHPLDTLAGLDAPTDWSAIGVAGRGRARLLDEATEPEPVRFLHVVARSGAWASRWIGRPTSAVGDGGSRGDGSDLDESTGLVDDACRRALALPTAPPAVTVVALLAAIWLDAVLEHVAAVAHRPPCWEEIGDLHPAAVIAPDPRLHVDGHGLAAAALDVAAVGGWAGVRGAASTGRWRPPGVDPYLAEWLDDGSFERLASSHVVPLDFTVGAVTALLPSAVGDEIRVALAAWGLAP